MQDLVNYIACSLVDEPDKVEVAVNDGRITLKVAEPDLGKIIGRQGRTVKAMRTLLSAAGGKQGSAFSLEVVK
jgi:predicted RNA-binding protein YlqC (UPF0109 family)